MSYLAAGYGTVADIEVLWCLIALVGALFSIANVRDALCDVQALYEPVMGREVRFRELVAANFRTEKLPRIDGVNGRYRLGWASLRVETARLVMQLINLSIGLMILTIPDSPASVSGWRIVVIGALLRWGLITGSLLLTYMSVENRMMRNHIRDIYRA